MTNPRIPYQPLTWEQMTEEQRALYGPKKPPRLTMQGSPTGPEWDFYNQGLYDDPEDRGPNTT
jgi:hypothetical protein